VRGPLDTGLLVPRVGAGLSLLVLFGIHKLGDAVAYFHTHNGSSSTSIAAWGSPHP
jgi:hypothetical protein